MTEKTRFEIMGFYDAEVDNKEYSVFCNELNTGRCLSKYHSLLEESHEMIPLVLRNKTPWDITKDSRLPDEKGDYYFYCLPFVLLESGE